MPCPGNGNTSQSPTPVMQANLRAWLDAGGRLFASHIPVQDFIYFPFPGLNPNHNVATWSAAPPAPNNPDSTDRSTSGNTLTDNINMGFPKGVAMAQWLQNAWPAPGGPGGAAPPLGTLPIPHFRHDVDAVSASATSWLSGASVGGSCGAGGFAGR